MDTLIMREGLKEILSGAIDREMGHEVRIPTFTWLIINQISLGPHEYHLGEANRYYKIKS
jgi:hypothetical protein